MKALLLIALCFWISFDLTDNTYVSQKSREPSSESAKETRNGYSKLRCPSEAEFKKWSSELNIDPIGGASLDEGCKVKSIRSQLAQVLGLAQSIKMNFPKNWAPTIQAEIKNSYEYVRGHTQKLRIDLTQTNTIARNLVMEQTIELGGMFFKEEPLLALSVLMHEARHSDARDQGHTTCRIGDIPLTAGGCDYYFSNNAANAGAYAYGSLFSLALAQYSGNLDSAEKEMLISDAFAELSTRFNTFKSTLAKHFDIVTVLLEDGSLAWIHPFSGELIPLPIELPDYQEKIKKIEYSPKTGSLMLFTASDRLFLWGPHYKIARLSAEATKAEDRFTHVSRQYVPYVNDYTYYTTLKTSGELEFIRFEPELYKYKIVAYPLMASANEPEPKLPNLKYFVLGNGMRSYFIDKQGVLSRAHNYANEPNFIVDKSVQSQAGGYQLATGGVFYDSLILTDGDGRLIQVKVSFPDGTDDEVLVKEDFGFQSPNRARKYLQGLNFHAVLDEDGSLLLENYRNSKTRVTYSFSRKISDFVITRITSADSSVFKGQFADSQLLQKCHIQKVIENIGYASTLGLTANGNLVSASIANQSCTSINPQKNYSWGKLEGLDSEDVTNQPFPDLQLKLTSQNEKLILLPYTRSSLDQSK